MKKLVMGLLGAMMILSLAACTPTTEKNKTGEVKEPQQEEVVESTADAPNYHYEDLELLYSLYQERELL